MTNKGTKFPSEQELKARRLVAFAKKHPHFSEFRRRFDEVIALRAERNGSDYVEEAIATFVREEAWYGHSITEGGERRREERKSKQPQGRMWVHDAQDDD